MSSTVKEVPVTKKLKNFQEIKELYERSFPKSERYPFWLLRLFSHREGFIFSAYYDEDIFCGFSYVILNDADAFGLYIAVNDKYRSKGYGAAMHEKCLEQAAGRRFNFNVEPLDDNAENAEQRRKRIKFHERNGNYLTDYCMKTGGDLFWIMSNREDFDKESFRRLLGRASFGLIRPKLTKR